MIKQCPECGEDLIIRYDYPYYKVCDNDYNEDE